VGSAKFFTIFYQPLKLQLSDHTGFNDFDEWYLSPFQPAAAISFAVQCDVILRKKDNAVPSEKDTVL
jgi:hypothetical protein